MLGQRDTPRSSTDGRPAERSSKVLGTLEHLPFPEFVQTLSNLGKSGRLTLSRFGEKGYVFFHEGRIVGAALTSMRETLGSLLVAQHLITEEQLAETLEIQRGSDRSCRLGSLLVERGLVSREDLQWVVRQQTQRILSALIRWTHGQFEFESAAIDDEEAVFAEILEMRLADGLSADGALLAAAVGADQGPAGALGRGVDPSATVPAARASRAALARDLLVVLRSPRFDGELTEEVMRHLLALASRYVVFSVEGDRFRGLGCYGGEVDDQKLEAIRALRIPLSEPSILAEVAARRKAFRGPLAKDPWNQKIVESLGGIHPSQALAAPLVVNERVTHVIYADSLAGAEAHEAAALTGSDALGSADEIELAMLQIGLATEKRLLEKSLAQDGVLALESGGEPARDVFRSLLDSDPEPIVVVDSEGAIFYANQALGDIVGKSPEELPGSDISLAIHPEDLPDLREILVEVGFGGAPGGNRVRLREAGGSWRRCYLLPSALGLRAGHRFVMLRALTAGEIHTRFDPLTGLLEYEALVTHLARRLERARIDEEQNEEVRPWAVLIVGLDRFTMVNVQYGWARGNEVLRTIADRLALNLRPGDLVSRAGGDRFCVILDRLRDVEDAALVAERLIEFLSEPIQINEEGLRLSVSLGVVTSKGGYRSADDMLWDAREALAEAKGKKGSAFVRHS
jgi:diguanylate cyclase (GGDEF)-like protein/PAS domain S-box-containing protein